MNPRSIYDLVTDVCTQYRKCEEVTQDVIEDGIQVTHVWNMPYYKEKLDSEVLIDCHFHYIGVNVNKAEARNQEFLGLIYQSSLHGEVGYIELGGVLGHQELAFMVFAVGEVLGIWKINTPERVLGVLNSEDSEKHKALLDKAAGMGLITVNWPKSVI